MPHNHRARTAASARIATALPRRVSSCVDLPALVLPFRFHFAASLRQAHGANPPRRKRSRRPSCLRSQPRGYHHRHRINYQQRRWGGSARVIWPCCSVCVSLRRDVPTGTVILRGVRDKNWTVVAACLRSFRRALTAVHPEPARGPTLVTSATQLKIGEPCEFAENHENRPEFWDVALQSRPTENGVSPPLRSLARARARS